MSTKRSLKYRCSEPAAVTEQIDSENVTPSTLCMGGAPSSVLANELDSIQPPEDFVKLDDHTVFKPMYTLGYWGDPEDNYNACVFYTRSRIFY